MDYIDRDFIMHNKRFIRDYYGDYIRLDSIYKFLVNKPDGCEGYHVEAVMFNKETGVYFTGCISAHDDYDECLKTLDELMESLK